MIELIVFLVILWLIYTKMDAFSNLLATTLSSVNPSATDKESESYSGYSDIDTDIV